MACRGNCGLLKVKFELNALPTLGAIWPCRLAIGGNRLERSDHVAPNLGDQSPKGARPTVRCRSWRRAGIHGPPVGEGGPVQTGVWNVFGLDWYAGTQLRALARVSSGPHIGSPGSGTKARHASTSRLLWRKREKPVAGRPAAEFAFSA